MALDHKCNMESQRDGVRSEIEADAEPNRDMSHAPAEDGVGGMAMTAAENPG